MTKTSGRQLGTISTQALNSAIGDHANWLSSDRKDGKRLELRGYDLSGHQSTDWSNKQLVEAVFDGSDLPRLEFQGCNLEKASFKNTTLSGTNFTESNLKAADFSGATWNSVNFTRVTADEAIFVGCKMDKDALGSRFQDARMSKVKILSAQCSGFALNGAGLELAELDGTSFQRASFEGADLSKASCRNCDFSNARFSSTKLLGTDLPGAKFRKADLRLAVVRDANFTGAEFLFGADRAVSEKVKDAEWATTGHKHDHFTWDRIRAIGSLAIFSASSVALAAIVMYAAAALWFNTQLERLAEHVRSESEQFVPDPLTMPSSLGGLLSAILALALAALIFKWRCPDAVKQYTELQWTRELDAPELEFRSAAHSRLGSRYLTLVLYLGGGLYVGGYAAWRVWGALKFAFPAVNP